MTVAVTLFAICPAVAIELKTPSESKEVSTTVLRAPTYGREGYRELSSLLQRRVS